MKGQGKNLLATLGYATVAVVAGIGLAASGGLDDKSAASDSRTLFKVIETKDEPAKKAKKPRLVGVVSGHTATGLLITPFSDAPVTPVKATAAQRERCPLDARYPDCVGR